MQKVKATTSENSGKNLDFLASKAMVENFIMFMKEENMFLKQIILTT